jgi:predicted phosphodiesterase
MLKKFKQQIESLAKLLGRDASTISKLDYFEGINPKTGKKLYEPVSEWDLRKLGGFVSVRNRFFPQEKDVGFISGSKIIKSYKNKLDDAYGKDIFMVEELSKSFSEALEKVKFYIHKPVKLKQKVDKKQKKRTLVAQVSDTHFGTNIDLKELGNINEFNWTIAARRMAFLADQLVNYKPEYRANTDLIIALNGDIIGGVIHNQEFFVDLLTVQQVGTISILTQFISYLAQHFKSVTVSCTAGNHGRMTHKSSKDRATTHKYDSHEHVIYHSLNTIFKDRKNVKFNIPMTPFAIIEVQGHKIFQTHGDTIINVGNPGKSISMKNINDQINKLNNSSVGGDGVRFAAVMVGHVHVSTVQYMENGCHLIINGCLSGLDPFANSLSIFESNPAQWIFESTEEHPVGDLRLVVLKTADKDSRLDKIIVPFKPSDLDVKS